jgi:hypothetical protein
MDRPGGTYWKTWDKHVREHLLRNALISPEDLSLYRIADDVDQAVRIIARFYRNFHSSRFVKDLLVLRLHRAPSPEALDGLNADFADIVAGAPMAVATPTAEERDDADSLDLPRIGFGFDRRSYGRLRELIDVLNNF